MSSIALVTTGLAMIWYLSVYTPIVRCASSLSGNFTPSCWEVIRRSTQE